MSVTSVRCVAHSSLQKIINAVILKHITSMRFTKRPKALNPMYSGRRDMHTDRMCPPSHVGNSFGKVRHMESRSGVFNKARAEAQVRSGNAVTAPPLRQRLRLGGLLHYTVNHFAGFIDLRVSQGRMHQKHQAGFAKLLGDRQP